MGVKVTRLYTAPDGASRFEDIELDLKEMERAAPEGGAGRAVSRHSDTTAATGLFFREMVGRGDGGWHNAPRRQIIITLCGAWEIETEDGRRRSLGPGDILLAEDTTGRGHATRNLNDEPRRVAVITLD